TVDKLFVARQPILDLEQKLFGYELLYRNSFENVFGATDETSATLAVIREAFLVLGTTLTGNNRVFINFDIDLLKKKVALILRPETTIIEIKENVPGDTISAGLCRELKQAGYTIALDDFDPANENARALVDLADLIKVDFRRASGAQRGEIINSYKTKKIAFVAEKVETLDEFFEAQRLGYLYFQGYFFGKPQIVSTRNILANKTNCLRVMSQINQPDMDFRGLEEIIRRDTYLTFTLLSYMNSAFFGLRGRVSSIMQALSLLGEREVRRWACLVLMAFIGADSPSEVTKTSLIRGRFCELLAGKMGLAAKGPELFMTGIFSMLDVLIGRPLHELLDMINVSKDIRIGLTTGDNPHGKVLQLVFAYEKALWEEVERWGRRLGLEKAGIASDYEKSVQWADEVFGLGSVGNETASPQSA
ncbi:MAG TPA: HDOD domain-containing protein, partial [Syntrophorhabdales bacterium]|nr:HDOD domain-containing protein [Syntrophorhabdales bacterium]